MDIHSQPIRAIKTVLLMGNIPHTEHNLSLWDGDTRKEEFLKIYPHGKIPLITQGDFKLGESNAILKYLCDTYSSVPECLWSKDPKLRALTD
jgi:glutathione S-transferase